MTKSYLFLFCGEVNIKNAYLQVSVFVFIFSFILPRTGL